MTNLNIRTRLQLFVLLIFIVETGLFAQNNTDSPYSILGIGEIETRDFGRTAGMGNVGIGMKSTNFLNYRNPAGLSTIDTLTFILDVSVSIKFSEFKTSSQSDRTNNFNFKNLAIGFRISKIWTTSVGLSPYSNVGYSIGSSQLIEGTNVSEYTKFTGNGGVNKFFWANSVQLFKGLSIGASASFLFGSINHVEELTGVLTRTETSSLNKLYVDFGAQYTHNIGDYNQLTVGGVYGYETSIKLNNRLNITTWNDVEKKDVVTASTKSYIPESYGAGLSLTHRKNSSWVLAADYRFQNWSVNPTRTKGLKYNDSHAYSLGFQIVPNERRPENYLQVMRYQVGGTYNQSYLNINGYQLEDYSVSVGVGLPFRNRSYINVALNLGQSGTGKRGGITENYALLSVNLSLIELWFAKQKYE